MKIYVIGKYENKDVVRETIEHLIRSGHEITEDWTQGIDASLLTGVERLEGLRQAAEADLKGAMEAEAIVVIHNDQLCGGLVELGAALADPRKIICIVGRPSPSIRRQPIFYWLPRVRFFNAPWDAVYFLNETNRTGWYNEYVNNLGESKADWW